MQKKTHGPLTADCTDRDAAGQVLERFSETAKCLLAIEQRIDLFLQSTQIGLWDWDLAADTLILSTCAAGRLRDCEDDCLKTRRSWNDIVHPEDRPKVLRELNACRSGESDLFQSEFRMQTVSGEWQWVLSRGKIVEHAQDGRPLRMAGSCIDITDRKQAEIERVRLSTAIEQARETVMIIDTNGVILYINPALETALGYTREEMIAQGLRIFSNGHGSNPHFIDVWDTISRGTVWSGHMAAKKKDGFTCELELTISPVRDTSEAVSCFVLIGRDVTREIKLKSHLRQAQKMEPLGMLAGGIAHDFNNILGAIIGFTQMSLEDVRSLPKVHKYLTHVLNAANRAKDLTGQILAISRQTERKKQLVMLTPIIKETIKFLRATLPTTIEIRMDIKAVQDTVMADPTQIHQIIMNLCTNSWHAMKNEGGVLTIGLRKTALVPGENGCPSDLPPGNYARITVGDTGVGIKKENIENVFEPYFTTKEQGEGTGLGLAVVKGIVASHSGSITVESSPGCGTTFEILLPIVERQKTEHAEQAEKPVPHGSETILLVDDEPQLVDAGREMLERLGYKVVGMTSPEEALARFKHEPHAFDLVITDKTMPKITGFDLVGKLLRVRPDVPVLLCTGFAEPEDVLKARNLGIKNFILKPLSKPDLAYSVREALA